MGPGPAGWMGPGALPMGGRTEEETCPQEMMRPMLISNVVYELSDGTRLSKGMGSAF